jgi:hypothetical protein
MMDPNQLIIGAVRIGCNGRDIGFSTDDGYSINPASTVQTFRGAQSPLKVHAHRSEIDWSLSVTVAQISQENLIEFLDLDTSPSGGKIDLKFRIRPTVKTFTLTGAAPNGGTRTWTVQGIVESVGEIVGNNKDYQTLPLTIALIGDIENNTLGTVVDTATSGTVPAVSSYQTVAGSTETTITTGATSVNVGVSIQATFNIPVRPDQLSDKKFILKENDSAVKIACKIEHGSTAGAPDYTKVKLTPLASLTASTEYEFIIVDGVLSNDGVPSTTLGQVRFTTAS